MVTVSAPGLLHLQTSVQNNEWVARFDVRLCNRPIKQFPVIFINIKANDSSSRQSAVFHINTGVLFSTGILKSQGSALKAELSVV